MLIANFDFETKTPPSLLALSLCICETILFSIGVVVPAYNMSKGGFALGYIGCQFDGFVVFWAVLNVALSTVVDRAVTMFSACYRYYLTTAHAWILIYSIWAVSLLLGTFPFITGSQEYAISLRTNKIMCMVHFL